MNCLWWPMEWNEMSNLNREPSIDVSYQVSVHLAKRFQRRKLKYEKLMDNWCQVMAKVHIDCQGELKRNKFNCFILNMSIYNMATTLTIMMIYIYMPWKDMKQWDSSNCTGKWIKLTKMLVFLNNWKQHISSKITN